MRNATIKTQVSTFEACSRLVAEPAARVRDEERFGRHESIQGMLTKVGNAREEKPPASNEATATVWLRFRRLRPHSVLYVPGTSSSNADTSNPAAGMGRGDVSCRARTRKSAGHPAPTDVFDAPTRPSLLSIFVFLCTSARFAASCARACDDPSIGATMNGLRNLTALLLVTALAACPETPEDPTSEACVATPLAAQVTERLSPGATVFLPTLAEGGSCDDRAWTLTSGPADNTNVVVEGTDGFTRFTVTAAGVYQFDAGEGVSFGIDVVSTPPPFHNYNYYPSGRSLARVGTEVWAADPFNAQVARFNAATLTIAGTVAVGSWPVALAVTPDAATVLVAQRASDTLGFIDAATGVLIDAVWVGDEPSNVLISPDGSEAYVALVTEGLVAVVDVEAREVVARIEAVIDPLAMALSDDGATLFVASHRSGHPNRFPYDADPVEEELDIAIIDVAGRSNTGHIVDVGTTLNALHFAGGQLWLSRTRNDTEANLGDTSEPSFMHEVVALAPTAGPADASTVIDITRAADSGGHAVSLHGLAACDGTLWVNAEGSDVTIGIDVGTGKESARVPTGGRPRGLLCGDGAVWVHGHQDLSVSRIDAATASITHVASTGTDPRPANMAGGQRYFTGAGRDFAQNWSCNSCHVDGLTDTIIWNAGPFSDRVVPRPFFWLEGTFPLGWAGYMSNVTNYAYTVNTNVGIRPDTDEALNLAEYLKSLMPPPAANGWTQRDGSLSPEAVVGKELFEGKASCASCHTGPMTTNRAVFAEGITEGVSDVPSLTGVYRHNVWLKHGEARTLRGAVVAAANAFGAVLDDTELDSVTRYIQELTGRDFFVLTQHPQRELVANGNVELVFSLPVWEDATNLARVQMTADGQPVEATVMATGRYLTVTPNSALPAGADVAVTLGANFVSYGGGSVVGATTLAFATAAAPVVRLEGDYVWTVDMPLPDFTTGEFGDQTVATDVKFSVGDDGVATYDYGEDLLFTQVMVVGGVRADSGPLPIPIGPSFSDSSGFQGDLVDADGDGVAETATGTVVISGPGFLVEDVTWQLARPVIGGGCEVGDTGTTPPTVTDNAGVVTIDWGTDTNALGVYVVGPDATLPFGPGTVDGDAYWVLEADEFPAGFPGPVTYQVTPTGATDGSVKNGAPEGGADLVSGECYKFAVITSGFETLETIVQWP